MFENLSDRLERSFKILKGEGKITEVNVAETLKEIRRALLDADVSYKVAKEFCDRVKTKAMGANVLTAVRPQQMMVSILRSWMSASCCTWPRMWSATPRIPWPRRSAAPIPKSRTTAASKPSGNTPDSDSPLP